MTSARRRVLAALAVALVVWLAWPKGQPTPGVPATPPYLTVFLIDGLSAEVFARERAAGRLPNLDGLAHEGALVPAGVNAFPSMTGYACYPFLTAEDAADSGMLGLRWFDRRRPRGPFRQYVGRTWVQMNRDMRAAPATLYERLTPLHTLTINTVVDRGAHTHLMTNWDGAMAKYAQVWWLPRTLHAVPAIGGWLAPDHQAAEMHVIDLAIADLPHRPKLQWVTFSSPDVYSHISGFDDARRALVSHIDSLVGRYRAASRALGQEQDRIYAVVADHGGVAVDKNLDLRAPLAAVGLKADRDTAFRLWGSALDDELKTRYAGVDAVLGINGNTMNYVYLRNPELPGAAGLTRRLTPSQLRRYPVGNGRTVDLIRLLTEVEGVELVVSLGKDSDVVVSSATGESIISGLPDGYAYVARGRDPLGYAEDRAVAALCDGAAHDRDTWLKATAASTYPGALERLHRLVTNADCGDLVVTAKRGFDLAKDFELFVGNYRGGHGGLRADQLLVPYVLAGPGVRRGVTIDTARAEDLGATLQALLGLAPVPGARGRVLNDALVAPGSPRGTPSSER